MPTSLAKRGTRAAVAAARPPAKGTQGIVVAIVAVTGHEDSVQDIIVPGAFTDTLKRRRPKLCWAHDWKQPLGRVLTIVELKPGDARLPKTLPDGRKWPAEAGALIATMQFNLRTQQGREFFEHAKEWAKNGEAAFSIGYQVTPGMASKRADGVRMIYQLELFEVSLVLHGAHNMALALEVKTAEPGVPLETKATDGLMEMKAHPDFSGHAMVALYPDSDAATKIAHPDGSPVDDLHVTLAYLGKADEVTDPEALAAQLAGATSAVGMLEGSVGGVGMFPAGDDGTPVWAPVDVPGLDKLRSAVVSGLDAAGQSYAADHGFTPHMTLGYNLPAVEPVAPTPVRFREAYLVVGGERYPLPLTAAPMEGKAAVAEARAAFPRMEVKGGVPGVADTPSDHAAVNRLRRAWSHGSVAAEIGWGTEGDFMRCVSLATKYMGPEDAKGWCNLRHHDALGMYPATHHKLEGKSAAAVLLEAKSTLTQTQETKAMPLMKGSYEERQRLVRDAIRDLLVPVEKDGEGGSGWVNIDAMFDDHAIATLYRRDDTEDTYKVPYTMSGEDVSLGKPVEVELSVVVSEEDGAPVVDEGAAVQLRFIDPTTASLSTAAGLIGAMPEGKSLDGITTPLLELLDALAGKGYDVAKAVMGGVGDDMWEEDEDMPVEHDQYRGEMKGADPDDPDSYAYGDEEEDPSEAEPDLDEDDDEEADPNEVEPDGDSDDVNPSSDTITLDPAAVRAQMDELRA